MTKAASRVLIVDDERAIRQILCVSLAAHHFAVQAAANGAEALVLRAAREPDLVILDLGLPDLDGIELTRQLREWNRVPIVILSVRNSEAEMVTALEVGADWAAPGRASCCAWRLVIVTEADVGCRLQMAG